MTMIFPDPPAAGDDRVASMSGPGGDRVLFDRDNSDAWLQCSATVVDVVDLDE